MNYLVNNAQLLGYIGNEPVLKELADNNRRCSIRLATHEFSKDADGKWVEHTSWHTVVFWGKMAEKIVQGAQKGSRIMVQGLILYREYTDPEDVKHLITEIKAHRLLIISRKQMTPGSADISIAEEKNYASYAKMM